MNGNKYLLRLVEALDQRQMFFIFWGLLAGIFVFLILRFYKKATQRNFKDGPDD